MKTFVKITGVVLVLVIIVAVMAVVPFGARQVRGIVGDADNDGKISILDATRIQRTLAALYKDEDHMTELLGDVNNNGLDILDATRIQRYLAGFSTDIPIGAAAVFEIDDPTVAPTEPPSEAPTKKDPYELPLVD